MFRLPHIAKKHDSIFIVVDRFSKNTRFILCTKSTNVSKVAKLYFDELSSCIGFPKL